MVIVISNVKLLQKTEGGHILETNLDSGHITQLAGNVVKIMNSQGYNAEPTIIGTTLRFANIVTKKQKTGEVVRVDTGIQARLAAFVSKELEQNYNIKAKIQIKR